MSNIVVIDSDSDDDCRIDESRSAPRPTVPLYPRQPRIGENSPRPDLPQGRQQRELTVRHPDHTSLPARKVSSPPTRQNSNPRVYISQPNLTTSKPNTAHKDYSDRQVEARESRRCTICMQDGGCCDGGRPCAYCFDTGFPCAYPGEEPVAPLTSPSPETTGQVGALQNNTIYRMAYVEDNHSDASSSERRREPEKVSSDVLEGVNSRAESANPAASGNDVPNFVDVEMENDKGSSARPEQDGTQKEPENPSDSNADIESDDEPADEGSDVSDHTRESRALELERIATTTWLPNSFDEVKRLIKTHQANIDSHREYIVEAQLASAKLKSKQNIHADTEQKGANPFKKMIAAKPDVVPAASTSNTLSMRIKPRRSDYTGLKARVTVLGEDKGAHIPEYKSIGRLRSTFLARNVHGLRYVPYNSGIEEKDLDQRRKDLETRFKDHSIEEFRRQRECLELVYQWSDDFDEILDELRLPVQQLWLWLSQNGLTKCPKCQTSCGDPLASISTLPNSGISKEERLRCSWLYDAFMRITQIGVWHFLSLKPGQVEKQQDTSQKAKELDDKKEQILCSLCFTHNCLTHGSFVDKEIVVGEAVINDPEEQNNIREKATLRVSNRMPPSHVCGLFCFGTPFSVAENIEKIIGVGEDGVSFSGLRNEKVKMLVDLGPFHGTELCDDNHHCFLNKDRQRDFSGWENDANEATRKLVLSMARLYSSNVRLPCMIANVTRLECMQVFFLLVSSINEEHQDTEAERQARAREGLDTQKLSAKAAGYHTGKSSLLENRRTWIPCSHKGPCLTSHSDCACAREQVHCEKACGCADNCRRRFKGCRCTKTCFLDDRCECYAANRECDPQLCHRCGVEEVLDPSNKYRDDIRQGRCRNNRLQLDLPPRTIKGMSEVQGWGLFLGEDLPVNSFVGEYKGENVSASESDRRGAIYAYVSQEYLFNLNEDNQLDGSRFGNKTRFINNSKAKEFINVFPKVMFVNGVTRIGLFTGRAIKAGEELLYDYGYPAELVKGEFWEKHERAIEHNGVVTPIAKPKFRPRMAKNAVDTPGQEAEEPSPVRGGGQGPAKKKRKRLTEEDAMDWGGERPAGGEEDDVDGHMLATGATDSSEYEESSPEDGTSSHGSGADEMDESEDGLSIPTRRVVAVRIDRRRGGEAQRRAAQTRLLNKQRARSG